MYQEFDDNFAKNRFEHGVTGRYDKNLRPVENISMTSQERVDRIQTVYIFEGILILIGWWGCVLIAGWGRFECAV